MEVTSVALKSMSLSKYILKYHFRNPDVRSVEEELEKALYRLGRISDYNYGDLKKIGWNRATRTDKRVHAI